MTNLFATEAAPLSLEAVASQLSFFYDQAHLLHWQTRGYAEHKALGDFYDKLLEFKDEIVEKLMGYQNRRVKAFKITPLSDYSNGAPVKLVEQVDRFAKQLQAWAHKNSYGDIENIAQSLSGEAQKTKYLLSLS